MRTTTLISTGLCAMLLATVEANAEVYRVAHNKGDTTLTTTLTPLPLTNGGATELTFTVDSKRTVLITFSGECSTDGNGGFAQIDIMVDGKARSVTDQVDDAFCTGLDYVMASVTIGVNVRKGTHTVAVHASVVGGTSTIGSMQDMSIAIFD